LKFVGKATRVVSAFLTSVLPLVVPAVAQQVTGTPGSPSATTTIDGKQISAPPPRPLERSNPNALQDELARHLKEDGKMSGFDFGLQFPNADCMTYWGQRRDARFWTENASLEWKETEAPFHTVGRLTLLASSQLTKDAAEAAYFDVTGHSTPDSMPVGSINRARWQGEVASRKARTRVEEKVAVASRGS